jgi:hypothetical protein
MPAIRRSALTTAALCACTFFRAAPTAAQPTPTPHAYQAPAPGATPGSDGGESTALGGAASARPDHRFEGSLRGGVMLPGEISPSNWFHTEANAAPSVGLDAGWLASRYFWLGGYLQLTAFTFDRMSGDEVIGEGDGTFASIGASAKGRLPVSDALTLAAGLTVGRNVIAYEGESPEGNAFELSGGGWNVGATTEALLRLSPKLGVSAQLSFLSQVSGSADLEGYPTSITGEAEGRDFSFKPIFFFSVGPTLYL